MYYVYVIKNSRSKIYIGQTENLEIRLKRHNGELSTKRTSFTHKNRNGSGWKVVYLEEYETRRNAIRREHELKSHKGRDWLRIIISGL